MGVEIERKFIVGALPEQKAHRISHIAQGYLNQSPERTVRIRLEDSQGYLTLKGPNQGLTRLEIETPMDGTVARQMLDVLPDTERIQKKRHYLMHEGTEWTVDVFDGALKGLILAEVELQSEHQVVSMPSWIDPALEVSLDVRFTNVRLMHCPDVNALVQGVKDQAKTMAKSLVKVRR